MESHRFHIAARSPGALMLIPSGDGWELVTRLDQPVFSAEGPLARRRCLEFAQREGVLAVFC